MRPLSTLPRPSRLHIDFRPRPERLACGPRSLPQRRHCHVDIAHSQEGQQQQQWDSSRRHALHLLGLAAAAGSMLMNPHGAWAKQAPGQWSSPGLDAPEDPALPKFFKTSSGVKVQELSEGSGEETAKAGDTVLFDYVLRRANGYFIYSTIEGVSFQPRDVPVGPVSFRLSPDSKLLPGLQEVLTGMKKGGKRRALIPATEGYRRGGDGVDIYCADAEPQPPTFATKRQLQAHCNEPLLFELEVLRITPPRA